jgi:hypothetical protein
MLRLTQLVRAPCATMVQLQVGKRMNLGLFARSILDMRLLGMMPQLAALRDRGGYHWVRNPSCHRQQRPQLFLLMTTTGPPQHPSWRYDTQFLLWLGTGMGDLQLYSPLFQGRDTRCCLDIGKAEGWLDPVRQGDKKLTCSGLATNYHRTSAVLRSLLDQL